MEDKNITDSPEKEIAGKKIMWVEDDETLNDIMTRWLSKYDLAFTHTNNGTNAMEMLRKQNPDILLLDIMLPDISGFEILEEMREDPDLKDIPVILFSNLSQQEDIDRGYKLGASRFMVKSTIFLDHLVAEIRNVLKEKGRL